jgi:nucleotide-binding universal stress UspA family protein
MHLRHILVPTDFSDGSAAAFAQAIELARESGARLTLIHVHHVPATALPDMLFAMTPDLMHDVEQSVAGWLEEWVERARLAGVVATARTMFGATHREICAAAAELGADLIVIGTHDSGGLSRALLGSTTERVMRRAPCPVLTVRPQGEHGAHEAPL